MINNILNYCLGVDASANLLATASETSEKTLERDKKGMTTTYSDLQDSEFSLEEYDLQYQDLIIVRILLEFQGDKEGGYVLSNLLNFGQHNGIDGKQFIDGINRLHEAKYIALDTNSSEYSLEQLMSRENYEKISISIQRPLDRLLVDSCIRLIRLLGRFDLYIRKTVETIKILDNNEEEFRKISQETKDYISVFQKKQADRIAGEKESWKTEKNSFKDETMREVSEKAKKVASEKAKEEASERAKEVVEQKLNAELQPDGRIGGTLRDVQKDIIQFMAIFVGVFSLLGLNIGNAGKWTPSEAFQMNLVIVTALSNLMTFLSIVMNGKSIRTALLLIFSIVLWLIAVFYFLVFPICFVC